MLLYRFFDYKADIEGYDGSDMFGLTHIIFMACAFLLMVLLCILLRNSKKKNIDIFLKVISIVLPILEIVKIAWETYYDLQPGFRESFNYPGLLPLYTCSLFMYTLPFAAFSKGKTKDYCLSFITTLGILAGLTNFVYLNILKTYPFWTFATFMSINYHFMMVFTGVLLLATGYYKPDINSIWKTLVVVALFSIIVIPANFIIENTIGGEPDYMLYMQGAKMPVLSDIAMFFKDHHLWLLNSFFMMTIGYGVASLVPFGVYKGICSFKKNA